MGKTGKKENTMKTMKVQAKSKTKPARKTKPLQEGKNKGNPLQQGKAKALTKRNLNKLGELSLGERVAMAGEEETEEAAVEALKGTMSKQDHSKVWGQRNTWLKKQPKEEQEAHAQKSEKEKGEAVVLWLLKTKVQRFQHHSQEVKGTSSTLQKERWVSLKSILKQWSEDELDAHLESGRILARQCKKTLGVWEYCDTQKGREDQEGLQDQVLETRTGV